MIVDAEDAAGAATLSHDIYVHVFRGGKASEKEELKVARGATILLAILSILLGIAFKGQNVAYMVGLAFAVAASCNFPVLLMSVFWKGMTTRGAVIGGFLGLAAAVGLVITGPTVWVKILGNATALQPYDNVAIFSMPIAFIGSQIGRLFAEFGVAVAAAVLFSGIIALSLTPMLCSRFLKAHQDDGRFVKLTEPFFVGMNKGYTKILEWALKMPVAVIGIAIVIAVMYVLSNQSINRTLVKQESDQNVALARTMLNSLWPRYAPLAKRAPRVPPAELVDQLENVQLRHDIYRLTRQLNIVKVRIFTPSRQIVFSNWDNEIGAFRAGDLAIEAEQLSAGPSGVMYRFAVHGDGLVLASGRATVILDIDGAPS